MSPYCIKQIRINNEGDSKMANSSTGNKKFPWVQISVVVLVLVIIGGIYVVKNTSLSNKDIQSQQDEITTQAAENSEQTNIENNSDSSNSSGQTSSTQASEQTSTVNQNSQQAKNSLPKLVDLGSTTCIPCKEMAPILDELKKEYKGKVDVEVVDVYEDQEKAMKYNEKHPIRVIPTQILFDSNGKEVWSHEGSLPKEDLVKVFKDKVGVK